MKCSSCIANRSFAVKRKMHYFNFSSPVWKTNVCHRKEIQAKIYIEAGAKAIKIKFKLIGERKKTIKWMNKKTHTNGLYSWNINYLNRVKKWWWKMSHHKEECRFIYTYTFMRKMKKKISKIKSFIRIKIY